MLGVQEAYAALRTRWGEAGRGAARYSEDRSAPVYRLTAVTDRY